MRQLYLSFSTEKFISSKVHNLTAKNDTECEMLVSIAGVAMRNMTCAYCGETIFRGEYMIQEGIFNRKAYHPECYRKAAASRNFVSGVLP
jgi:hypothetical protein